MAHPRPKEETVPPRIGPMTAALLIIGVFIIVLLVWYTRAVVSAGHLRYTGLQRAVVLPGH